MYTVLLTLFLLFFSLLISAQPTEPLQCQDGELFICHQNTTFHNFFYWCALNTWVPCPGGARCDLNRTEISCQKDGTPIWNNLCGDGVCGYRESCRDCPTDCKCDECGDGICGDKETCVQCPQDCGACRHKYEKCGNNICDDGEDCSVCPYDCGTCYPYACSPTTCVLPDCRCASNEMPSSFSEKEMPQFVYLTFDDAITPPVYKVLRELMDGFDAFDSSGCPPKPTFFVLNDNNDYFYLQDLVDRYHGEIAAHTISHNTSMHTTEHEWRTEIEFGKKFLSEMAMYPAKNITGFRAPVLEYNPELFLVLADLNFTYDATITNRNPPGKQYWPYTLNHGVAQPCSTGLCPEVSIPGLWEFPINVLFQDGSILTAVDPITPVENGQLLDMYKDNFVKHYKGNKSPFGIVLHPAWLIANKGRIKVLQEFFKFAAEYSNVFFRTPSDIIDWLKNPTAASEMKGKDCKYKVKEENTCPNGRKPLFCKYPHEDRYFNTCHYDCYKFYPSMVGNFEKLHPRMTTEEMTETMEEDTTSEYEETTIELEVEKSVAKATITFSFLLLIVISLIAQ